MDLEITVYEDGVALEGRDHEELIVEFCSTILHDIVIPLSYEIELRECVDGTRVLVCTDKGRQIRFPKQILDAVLTYSDGTQRRLVGDKHPLTADERIQLLLEEWN